MALWKVRRKAIHEDIFQSPHSVNSFISNYLGEMRIINAKTSTQSTPTVRRSSRWVAPTAGNAKINVDAAVSRRGYGSVGAICRDQDGSFLGASSLRFPNITDPPTLEALAIRESLALADDLNLRRIQVASDCKLVVQSLRKDNRASYGAIVHEILDHSVDFDFCNFSHEFRSSNYEAHNIVKDALSLDGGRHVWLGNPENLPSVPVNIMTN